MVTGDSFRKTGENPHVWMAAGLAEAARRDPACVHPTRSGFGAVAGINEVAQMQGDMPRFHLR
jgi:hypothetical protein